MTLTAIEDATIGSLASTTHYGSAAMLEVEHGQPGAGEPHYHEVLMRFDHGPVPAGAKIDAPEPRSFRIQPARPSAAIDLPMTERRPSSSASPIQAHRYLKVPHSPDASTATLKYSQIRKLGA